MNRWLWIPLTLGLLSLHVGCACTSPRGGACSSGSCGPHSGDCGCNQSAQSCNCQQCGRKEGGLFGKGHGRMAGCHTGCGRTGCQAGPLGWQQGGLDYSSHMNPGLLGHQAAHQLQNQPFTPGPPSAQVAYPYYSFRGPRDFLLDNPPSIGP